ncbi:hypothetical protein D3C76_738740 [compost metagenome]
MQGLDAGTGHHAQVALHPTYPRRQHAGVQAIGLADDGGQVAEVGEIGLAVGQRFVHHRPGALEEVPVDANAVLGEFLLQQLLVTQHVDHATGAGLAARAEVGHGDADACWLGRFSCVGAEGEGQPKGGDQVAQRGFHGKAPWQAATGDGRRFGQKLGRSG